LFEASHSERSSASPAAIWALWSDASRWPDWNEQLESAELEGEFAVGQTARVKFRRGGRMQFRIVAVEPESLFVDEARLPGARLGHEHRLEPAPGGVQISHRLYVAGPLSGLFAPLLGRKRMRESVARFIKRERELVE
jgi:hypothetical protein